LHQCKVKAGFFIVENTVVVTVKIKRVGRSVTISIKRTRVLKTVAICV